LRYTKTTIDRELLDGEDCSVDSHLPLLVLYAPPIPRTKRTDDCPPISSAD
jgi:hypothetical protein